MHPSAQLIWQLAQTLWLPKAHHSDKIDEEPVERDYEIAEMEEPQMLISSSRLAWFIFGVYAQMFFML